VIDETKANAASARKTSDDMAQHYANLRAIWLLFRQKLTYDINK